jgi:coiled-coil domain-containing protein 55
VTEAYLQKQAELRALEEAENKKKGMIIVTAEMDLDPNRERDVAGFFRDILESREAPSSVKLSAKELAAIKADEELARKDEAIKIAKLKESSASIQVNESDEILDKRQLLTGGLNMTFKAVRKQHQVEEDAKEREEHTRKEIERERIEKREQQDRARIYLEQQQRRIKAQQEAEKAAAEKVLAEKLASKVTTTSVLSAKERYLQRKAEQLKQQEEPSE